LIFCVLRKKADIYQQLYSASKLDLGDWFQFEVAQSDNGSPEIKTSTRYNVVAYVDSRKFEEFHLDISINDELLSGPEFTESTGFLTFAEIAPVMIPRYSIEQQISEKFHALTRTYASGEPSRVKDLVDILLMANTIMVDFKKLSQCIQFTFECRGTHKVPNEIPLLSEVYSQSYHSLAINAQIRQETLVKGNLAFTEFLSPVVKGREWNVWNPDLFHWE
jgi:hypothetical protein